MEKRIPELGNIIIENRERTSIAGVIDVIGFDDETISLNTNQGGLTVQGRGFKINNLNVDSGELVIDGLVHGVTYEEIQKEKESLWGRMFK